MDGLHKKIYNHSSR